MKGKAFSLKSPTTWIVGCAVALLVAAVFPHASTFANSVNSGQTIYGRFSVEPAIDDSTGSGIYLLTPVNAPLPSKSNPTAAAPLYLVAYPLESTVNPADLNCQPTNCDHVNVLPFPDPDYGALPGTDTACKDFNGGNPCSPLEGHDHLVGIASTGGEFNVAWHVKLVIFSHAAFQDGKINTRVTTLAQIQALVGSGDAFIADTPITFNCSLTTEQIYNLGTPVVISYP